MKYCAVCYRQGRGFGAFNPTYRYNDINRFKDMKAFCSRDCMELYRSHLTKKDNTMIDLTLYERQAMNEVLKPLGEYVVQVGMNKLLTDYSLKEIQSLVEIVVTTYQKSMRRAENYTQDKEYPF